MDNGKIFFNNLCADATLSVTTEASGFEKEYLCNHNQGVVWRSTGITENIIQISFADAIAIKGVVVLTHNLESGDSFYFEASADNFATVAQSETIDHSKGFIEVEWNYKDYRLRMQKSSGDYIQVGEIYLPGSVYDFSRNYSWGYSYFKEINRSAKQTTSGQIYRKIRYIRQGFNMDFEGLSDAQKEIFGEISESNYICFLPQGISGEIYYGIIDFSTFVHLYENNWNTTATFTENPE